MKPIQERDIDALLQIFDRSTWREMHLTAPGVDLFVSKDPHSHRPVTEHRGPALASGASPVAATTTTAVPVTVAAAPAVPAHWVAVRAPCLGTFYSTPKPGAPAFVSVGQHVEVSAELCLIEVMKLFTSVRAAQAGTIRQIVVADATLVEFDEPLFYIEPGV